MVSISKKSIFSFYLCPTLNEFWFFAIFGEFCSFFAILMSLGKCNSSILQNIRWKLPGWLFLFQKWAYLCFHHDYLSHNACKRRGRWNRIVEIPIFSTQNPILVNLPLWQFLRGSTCWYLVFPFLFKCITRYHCRFSGALPVLAREGLAKFWITL